jgi:hypothetical protein
MRERTRMRRMGEKRTRMGRMVPMRKWMRERTRMRRMGQRTRKLVPMRKWMRERTRMLRMRDRTRMRLILMMRSVLRRRSALRTMRTRKMKTELVGCLSGKKLLSSHLPAPLSVSQSKVTTMPSRWVVTTHKPFRVSQGVCVAAADSLDVVAVRVGPQVGGVAAADIPVVVAVIVAVFLIQEGRWPVLRMTITRKYKSKST